VMVLPVSVFTKLFGGPCQRLEISTIRDSVRFVAREG